MCILNEYWDVFVILNNKLCICGETLNENAFRKKKCTKGNSEEEKHWFQYKHINIRRKTNEKAKKKQKYENKKQQNTKSKLKANEIKCKFATTH